MMLIELKNIQKALNILNPRSFPVIKEAQDLIEREIRLKTMNPVKPKEVECSCGYDNFGCLTVPDPACPEHGISQQLNKSQME